MLNAFRRQLRMAGYQAFCCDSGREGLELLETHEIDVVCSDYRMPEMDGIAFLGEAQRRRPHVPRIMVTAYQDFQVAAEAVQVGVCRVVGKPWNDSVLLGYLADAVATARLHRENDRLQTLVRKQVAELSELNANLDLRLTRRTDQVISALVTCLDYRDEQTMAHSKRVSLFTRAAAEQMGFSEPDLTDVEWGAMLHDVGKIGVPDAVLLKRGPLTEAEWRLMRRHVSIGENMIGRIDFLANASRVVADHHERFDGSGYPHGKSAEDIYLGARIFAVADTFDAITSDRPYRRGQADTVAIDEIRRVSGTELDARCVEAFLAVPPERVREIRGSAARWARTHRGGAESSVAPSAPCPSTSPPSGTCNPPNI